VYDPFAIDRRLREVARAWLAWRRALRRGSGEDHRFEHLGAFASAELIRELDGARAVDPLAPSLRAWALRLHLEHQTRDLVAARERAFRTERHPLESPASGKFTLRELLEAALADTKGARGAWFDAIGLHAAKTAELEMRRWERHAELSNALGDAAVDPNAPARADIVARARAMLERTDDAFAELGVRSLASLVERGLGRGSTAAWPARLTTRSLAGLFDEAKWFEHVALEFEELPQPFGASSFLRGLVALGAALRSALVPASLPFATGHDPFDLRGATFGALFALVPSGESFARRKLGVPRSRLSDHRRELSRVLLVGARTSALRVVLREPTLSGAETLRRAYPELVFRALRVELAPRTAAVLLRSRLSDLERFAALLSAVARAKRLENVHDEDWYRNPRAVEELRETARHGLDRVKDDELDLGLRELGHACAGAA
jgi:hypothetical protein